MISCVVLGGRKFKAKDGAHSCHERRQPSQGKLRTSTEELRVERELTKEKDEQLAAARERANGLAAKAIEGFQ